MGYFVQACQYIAYILLFRFILNIIYNRYLHPLRNYPGPFLASTTRLPYIKAYVQGTSPQFVRALHDRYGNVVRIAPDELSFRDATAWMEIYGGRKPSLLKDTRFYNVSKNGVPNLVVAPTDEIHHRQRRIISRAFSDTVLKDQETLLQSYVDLYLEKIDERANATKDRAINVLEWFHFVTFDFMTEYIFGESFSCLQNSEYHPWVRVIIDTIKAWPVISSAKYLPSIAPLLQMMALFFYRDILRRRRESFQLGLSKMRKRLARENSGHYSDFISHVHSNKKSPELSLTQGELDSNSSFLVLAGSETLSTSLSGCTYYLLTNQSSYAKLSNEIRQSFSSLSDITFAKLAKLPFLDAVINETFRIRPPAPLGMPRCVPAGGCIISGQHIPEGMTVSVPHWASYRSSYHFTDPDEFIPERWLRGGDERFVNDSKDILQPFSVGPRNCLGKSLALAELRLILAKTLWKFDMELCEDSYGWDMKQRAFVAWDNTPLMVRLISRGPNKTSM